MVKVGQYAMQGGGLRVCSLIVLIVLSRLFLRLLLMPFTIQGDVVLASWIAHFVALGHWNPYSYYFLQYGSISFPPSGRMQAVGFLQN